MSDEALPIRSYRVCFDLERRIHQVDKWRIPVPYGLSLRGIGYAAFALLLVIGLARVPVLGPLVGSLHPALRLVVVPSLAGVLMARVRIDGRVAHAHMAALLCHGLASRWVAGFRPMAPPGPCELADLELAPDLAGARVRRATVAGPCRVIVRYPMRVSQRGRKLCLQQLGDEPLWSGKTITVPADARVVVR